MHAFLHLSDLHRYPDDYITNLELVNSLVSDLDRLRRDGAVPERLEGAIVSGDLVRGVPVGAAGYPQVLKAQYTEAIDFLRRLCNEFFDGQPSKVVIVPGNHDVDWNVARESMVEVPGFETDPTIASNLETLVRSPALGYRWSWRERKLYRIEKPTRYDQRFDSYRAAAAEFYGNNIQGVPFDSSCDFHHHVFLEGRILITAFNSCYHNDCFCPSGAIEINALEEASTAIRAHHAALNIAVWHHDIEGRPSRGDYMDTDVVRRLLDRGYQLGFHGHDHKSSVSPLSKVADPEDEIVLIGAGSLGAGMSERPPGYLRQYNVVNLASDLRTGQVLVREMEPPGVFRGGRALGIRVPFTVRPPSPPRFVDVSNSGGADVSAVESIERLIRTRRYPEALDLIARVRIPDHFGRQLKVWALRESGNWSGLLEAIGAPRSPEEAIEVVNAHLSLGEWHDAFKAVDAGRASGLLTSSIAADLRRRVEARRTIG